MFKNVILVIVFNYSNAVHNAKRLIRLYENHFKKVIIYSDIPEIKNSDVEVNFIDIKRGINTPKIFKPLYEKYYEDIMQSDGLCYTMDDNVINLNILRWYNKSKILFPYKPIHHLIFYRKHDKDWEWWASEYGLKAINNMEQDNKFYRHNIIGYCRTRSDFFYLPKKYLKEQLFNCFEMFGKYNVFLEISIPTIIGNIERNKEQYSKYSAKISFKGDIIKMSTYRRFKRHFKYRFNLYVHPIKFNQNPQAMDWVESASANNNKWIDISKRMIIFFPSIFMEYMEKIIWKNIIRKVIRYPYRKKLGISK